jgi:hypothetical protein
MGRPQSNSLYVLFFVSLFIIYGIRRGKCALSKRNKKGLVALIAKNDK